MNGGPNHDATPLPHIPRRRGTILRSGRSLRGWPDRLETGGCGVGAGACAGRSDRRSLRKKSHRTRPTEKPVKSAPAATLVLAVNCFSLPIRLASRSRAIPVHRPDSLLALIFLYDQWALNYKTHLGTRKEHPLALTPQQRWKLDRFRKQVTGFFGRDEQQQPRPKLCPACGTLVGAGATRCHQCGASMTFSVAAASKSLGRLLPATSPATYGILGPQLPFLCNQPAMDHAFKRPAAARRGPGHSQQSWRDQWGSFATAGRFDSARLRYCRSPGDL